MCVPWLPQPTAYYLLYRHYKFNIIIAHHWFLPSVLLSSKIVKNAIKGAWHWVWLKSEPPNSNPWLRACVLHRMTWHGSKVDHLLMPGCPEVENSYQDPFPSLSVFQYSVLIINGCGLEMGAVLPHKKRTPLFRALDPPLDCMHRHLSNPLVHNLLTLFNCLIMGQS